MTDRRLPNYHGNLANEHTGNALEALQDERVHLLICINLLENSDSAQEPHPDDLAKRLENVDDEIARLTTETSPWWRIHSLPKSARPRSRRRSRPAPRN